MYWYGQDSFMLLALPSIPCWDWSSKGDQGRGVRAPHLFFSMMYQNTLCSPLQLMLPPPHLTFPHDIMRLTYITRTSANGSRLYYTLPIQSWLSCIQTISSSIIYWYGQSKIMLAFTSIPCWDWNMIWWVEKAVKKIKAEVWGLHIYSFLCCTEILCAPHCSWCCPHQVSLFHMT